MNESVLAAGVVASTRRVVLPGGMVLLVRRVVPADVGGLTALYRDVTAGDVATPPSLGQASQAPLPERVATVESRGGFGVVAVIRLPEAALVGDRSDGERNPATWDRVDPDRCIGQASYERLASADGEMSMAVAPAWRGWLGGFLLDALVDAAASRGVPNLETAVAASDVALRAALTARGLGTDPATERVILGTHGTTPTGAGAPDPHSVLPAAAR
jgi:hypothetical protein